MFHSENVKGCRVHANVEEEGKRNQTQDKLPAIYCGITVEVEKINIQLIRYFNTLDSDMGTR